MASTLSQPPVTNCSLLQVKQIKLLWSELHLVLLNLLHHPLAGGKVVGNLSRIQKTEDSQEYDDEFSFPEYNSRDYLYAKMCKFPNSTTTLNSNSSVIYNSFSFVVSILLFFFSLCYLGCSIYQLLLFNRYIQRSILFGVHQTKYIPKQISHSYLLLFTTYIIYYYIYIHSFPYYLHSAYLGAQDYKQILD